MSATSDRSLLVEAEEKARAGIPGARVARVPAGLMVALPLVWGDDNLVCLSLRAASGRLRLVCEGGLVASMADAGHDLDGPSFRGALLCHGLRYEAEAAEIACEIEALDGFVARAVAMGAALLEISRSEPMIERIAA